MWPDGGAEKLFGEWLGHRDPETQCPRAFRFRASLDKELHATRASGSHTRLWNQILRAALLILDDFGRYVLTLQAAQNLHEIISKRYERASRVITSNRAFEEWSEVFGNDLLDGAALDRLTHHIPALSIRGSSYRQRQRRKEKHSTALA